MTTEDKILMMQEIRCGESCADDCSFIDDLENENSRLEKRIEELEKVVKWQNQVLLAKEKELERLERVIENKENEIERLETN